MVANNKGPRPVVVEGQLPGDYAAALLYTTFPTLDGAVAAGRHLVEARLAGCINILPAMTSVYVWEGVTEVAAEVVVLAKVPPEHIAACMAAIRGLHPYDTPALLVLPVLAGSTDYLAWLRAGTGPASPLSK